jgi:hypothetical protein
MTPLRHEYRISVLFFLKLPRSTLQEFEKDESARGLDRSMLEDSHPN